MRKKLPLAVLSRKHKGNNWYGCSKSMSKHDNRWKDTVELSEPSPIQYAQRHTKAIQKPHHVNRCARQVRYLARHFGFYSVHVEHVANRPSYTEQSDTRQTGRLKATFDPIREEESKRRHLLHRKLHGHADKSNRLKISEAPAELRVADYPWQSWDDVPSRVEIVSPATPGVTRTCTREQPIEDIGSTGRVHESSRLCMAKLKLNGVRHVYQTCQADVKTCHLKAKSAN